MGTHLDMLEECRQSLRAHKIVSAFFAFGLAIFLCLNIVEKALTEKADFTKTHMKVVWKIGDIEQTGWIPRNADVLMCEGSLGFEYYGDKTSRRDIQESEKQSVPESYDGPWTTQKNLVFYFDSGKSTGFLMK